MLRIDTTEIPFLAEHELPDEARRNKEAAAVADEMNQAAGEGISPIASSSTSGGFPGSGHALGGASSTSASASNPKAAAGTAASGNGGQSEANIKIVSDCRNVNVSVLMVQLVELGAPRAHAVQLLEAAGGNVDVAVSMLFG